MPSLHRPRKQKRPRLAGRLPLLAAAALALPMLAAAPAPSASAGDVNWRVTVGSSHDRGHYNGHRRGHYRGGGGYYKSVWHPPVYKTRYDDCGRAIRVCVRRGYYDRVWVSAPRHRVRYHSGYHQPRHQRYDRYSRYSRRGCSW
ncbi:MAG: hypothetical protein AAF333_05990 [Planctomycetota bacterium]